MQLVLRAFELGACSRDMAMARLYAIQAKLSLRQVLNHLVCLSFWWRVVAAATTTVLTVRNSVTAFAAVMRFAAMLVAAVAA